MDGIQRLGIVLLTGLLLCPAGAGSARAGDEPQYRDEMDERLGSADSRLLDLQMARFRALFGKKKDEEEIEKVDKEFRELQKERRELLRATGRMP
jgi:5-methylcytosine-specific restriction endonuclease McrBC GTP-binding regulatory subunit McrB